MSFKNFARNQYIPNGIIVNMNIALVVISFPKFLTKTPNIENAIKIFHLKLKSFITKRVLVTNVKMSKIIPIIPVFIMMPGIPIIVSSCE